MHFSRKKLQTERLIFRLFLNNLFNICIVNRCNYNVALFLISEIIITFNLLMLLISKLVIIDAYIEANHSYITLKCKLTVLTVCSSNFSIPALACFSIRLKIDTLLRLYRIVHDAHHRGKRI